MKAQAAIDFLTTYGFAILIIAIVLSLILYYMSGVQSSIPSTCTISFGAYCNELLAGTTPSGASGIAFVFTNEQKYPIANPSIEVNVSGYGLSGTASCNTDYVLPGGIIICTFESTQSFRAGSGISGSMILSYVLCPNGNAETCTSPEQEYKGTFNTEATTFASNVPIGITLSSKNLTFIKQERIIQLNSSVYLFGVSVPGATVSFSSSQSFARLNSSIGTTSVSGIYSHLAVNDSAQGCVIVTSSFAGRSASLPICFKRIYSVLFDIISDPFSVSPQTQVLTVDGNEYVFSQMPLTLHFNQNTTHTYAFSSVIPGIQQQTRYAYLSISGCSSTASSGIINATHGCNVTAAYHTQYYISTTSNPANLQYSSVSPSSGWYDSGSGVTLSASFDTAECVRRSIGGGKTPLGSGGSSSSPSQCNYVFNGWTGTGQGSYTGSNPNPRITVNGPITETANFALPVTTTTTSTTTSSTTSTISPYIYSVNPFIYSYLLFGSYFAYSPSTGGIGGWQTNNYPAGYCGVFARCSLSNEGFHPATGYCPDSGYLRNDYGSASGNNYAYSLGQVITGYDCVCTISRTPHGPIVTCGARPVYAPGGETAPLTSSGTGTWQQNIGSTQASEIGNANACAVSAGYIYCPATGYSLSVSPSGVIGTAQGISSLSGAASCSIEQNTIYCITSSAGAYWATVSNGAVSSWSQAASVPVQSFVPSGYLIGTSNYEAENNGLFSISCYTTSNYIYCIETGGYTDYWNSITYSQYYNYAMYSAPIYPNGIGSWARISAPNIKTGGQIYSATSNCQVDWNSGDSYSSSPFSCVKNQNNLLCVGGQGGDCYITGGLVGCTYECSYNNPLAVETPLGSQSASWYEISNYPNGYTGMSIV